MTDVPLNALLTLKVVKCKPKNNNLGGDSQIFLCKFVIFFVTLGLKVLRLLGLKVVFEADINKS